MRHRRPTAKRNRACRKCRRLGPRNPDANPDGSTSVRLRPFIKAATNWEVSHVQHRISCRRHFARVGACLRPHAGGQCPARQPQGSVARHGDHHRADRDRSLQGERICRVRPCARPRRPGDRRHAQRKRRHRHLGKLHEEGLYGAHFQPVIRRVRRRRQGQSFRPRARCRSRSATRPSARSAFPVHRAARRTSSAPRPASTRSPTS
jgi:hypothetical protein